MENYKYFGSDLNACVEQCMRRGGGGLLGLVFLNKPIRRPGVGTLVYGNKLIYIICRS